MAHRRKGRDDTHAAKKEIAGGLKTHSGDVAFTAHSAIQPRID